MIDLSRFSTDQLVYAISVTSLAIWLLLLIVQKVIMTKAAPAAAPAANAAAGTALSRPAAPMPGEMTKALSAQDREFLPAALELLETPPSPVRIAGIWLISATFAAALLWAYFGKLDIHAIAQGRIQPSGRSKVIQPLEPGKVVAVLVENGSRVKAGDVLLELDPTDSGADREAQTRDLEAARAEAARRLTAIDIATDDGQDLRPVAIHFDASISDAVRRREEHVLAGDLGQLRSSRLNQAAQLAEKIATRDKLASSIKSREKVIALAKERVDMRTTLNDQGSLSRALVIEVLSSYEQLVTQQVSEKGQLIETEAAILTVKSKIEEMISQFIADQSQKTAEAERKSDRIAQDLIKATAKNERSTLKTPISGIVQQLSVTTVGQVVNGGQSLMTIVPADGPIEIEVMVLNQDIGFVKPGQEAVIKIEAFPFTRFGTISGKIMKVSREAIDEREAQGLSDPQSAGKMGGAAQAGAQGKSQNLVFPAIVRLEHSTINVDGAEVALSPGMAVTVEILTGNRRAIDYVLSPLREVASSTARER